MPALRRARLPFLCRSHRSRTGADRPLPAGRGIHHCGAGAPSGRPAGASRHDSRSAAAAGASLHRRGDLHRLHAVHPRMPHRCDRRRPRQDAYGDRRALHRVRACACRPARSTASSCAPRAATGATRTRNARACSTPCATSASPIRCARGAMHARAQAARARSAGPPWPPHWRGRGRAAPLRDDAMNPAKRREIYERLRAQNPNPRSELEYANAVRAARRGRSVGAGDRPQRQSRDRPTVPEGEHPEGNPGAGRGRAHPLHQDHRAVPHQGEEHHRAVPATASRSTAANVPADHEALDQAAGCRSQDRQRRAQRRLRPADDRGGHAHLSGRQPHRAGAGQDTPRRSKRKLVKFTPAEFQHDAHHWLILHGRYMCIARKPKCPDCVIADLCEYKHKTREVPQLPRTARANPGKARRRL